MKRFVEGADRGQGTLLPECLDDWIEEENPVRVIDAFVDALDLAGLGFDGIEPAATGRPGFHPSVLLKLYIYGYLNRVQSSRRLEREAGRNLELLWLLGRLVPDHKTIADFRKDNGPGLRQVCARFVELCRELGLLATASVAIDGSKFKAVNNRDRNFTKGKVERRRAQLEESVARYLAQLDTADRQEPTEALAAKAKHLKEKLAKLDGEMKRLAAYERKMLASPDQQISLTDPDSRSMATSGRGSGVVGYNVQVAVETENHLIVTHEVTNTARTASQLARIGKQAKAVLRIGHARSCCRSRLLQQPGDPRVPRGRHHRDAAQADDFGRQVGGPLRQAGLCLSASMRTSIAARPASASSTDTRTRRTEKSCDAIGRRLAQIARSNRTAPRGRSDGLPDGSTSMCSKPCSSGSMPIPNAMRQRRETVEHPFGTIKARMGATHFLTKTLPKVAAEMALHVLAYNFTRVMNIVGIKPLMAAITA